MCSHARYVYSAPFHMYMSNVETKCMRQTSAGRPPPSLTGRPPAQLHMHEKWRWRDTTDKYMTETLIHSKEGCICDRFRCDYRWGDVSISFCCSHLFTNATKNNACMNASIVTRSSIATASFHNILRTTLLLDIVIPTNMRDLQPCYVLFLIMASFITFWYKRGNIFSKLRKKYWC